MTDTSEVTELIILRERLHVLELNLKYCRQTRDRLRSEIENFKTYGQGGASFEASQWIDRLATAEQQRDAALERVKDYKEMLVICREYLEMVHEETGREHSSAKSVIMTIDYVMGE